MRNLSVLYQQRSILTIIEIHLHKGNDSSEEEKNTQWKTRLCNLNQSVSLASGIFRKAAVWVHHCGS